MSKKVGKCPNCEFVYGEDVNLNFPNTPTCGECGADLDKARVVPDEEFEAAMA